MATQSQVLEPVLDHTLDETHDHGAHPTLSHHEYELHQSESLTFLYNLLYDPQSQLSRLDILSILNSLKNREDKMLCMVVSLDRTDLQGVRWPMGLKDKFYADRLRVGQQQWFYNVPLSRQNALQNVATPSVLLTEFFTFHRFFSKLRLHITHFQLRNLVCCGTDISRGIYYPLCYFHDYNMQTVGAEHDETYSYFRINRLKQHHNHGNDIELDCMVDSRSLAKNSNNRVSTMACTNNLLACGTFEGGYILMDANTGNVLGEHHLTSNADGITNHIIIDESNDELIVSSNDRWVRVVDTHNRTKSAIHTDFTVNCAAHNWRLPNELFVTGDCTDSFIIDTRAGTSGTRFSGHTDYGFGCDWSPKNEHLLVTGNQDGTVRLWDRRNAAQALFSWSGSLGSQMGAVLGGPVRNCRFSHTGDFVAWAESLDHIGMVNMDDLLDGHILRVQLIDFIGKCTGISFAPVENGCEQMIVGVTDCSMGGILSYRLDLKDRVLDFDFSI